MDQTSPVASASLCWTRFHHAQARAWTPAVFLGLLTGCLATANVVSEAPSDTKSSPRVSRLERNYFALPPEPASPGPSSFAPETPLTPLASYSEDYWTALSNLDLTALRNAAQSEPEIGFADGMALLAGGEHERAESAFVATSRQAVDLNVAVASQIMLAKSLLYRRKWTTLRDLAISSSLAPADRESTAELEKWGKAFAGVDEQTAVLPAKPVSLQLGTTAVGTPTVRVRINGKEYDFWLDTGSSMTVLSSRVASDAHVPIVSPDTLSIGTFQGVAPVRPAIVKRLEIGPIVFGSTPAIVMDAGLMRIKSTAQGVTGGGLRVDGIIGWDIIRQLDITMDYGEETITIDQPARAGMNRPVFQNLVWVGKPLVEVTTPSGGTFHFTLDTGAQATFLNAAILERMEVVTETHSGRVFGFNKTGGQTERVVPALTLGIGGISLRLERVIVYGPFFTSMINSDGILGSDIARFGKIRIDATNGVFSVGETER